MRIFGWMADHAGCGTYRIQIPLEQLGKLGHHVEYSTGLPPRWRGPDRRADPEAIDADIVIGQRVFMPGPSYTWQRLHEIGRCQLVYEIDDNIFDVDPSSEQVYATFSRREHQDQVRRNMEIADLVTVTTPDLADVCRQHNDRVAVLPNCLPDQILDIDPAIETARTDGDVLIGWQGSPTHRMDFSEIAQPLSRVLRRNPHALMRFIGTVYPDSLPPAQVQSIPGAPLLDYYALVAQFDIGLAPLRPHPFNRSKSWLRVLEYAALGVPYVASGMPAYELFTDQAGNGFIAHAPHQWERYLAMLIQDPQLRYEMGQRGRQLAAAWTIGNKAHLWETAYRSLLTTTGQETTTDV